MPSLAGMTQDQLFGCVGRKAITYQLANTYGRSPHQSATHMGRYAVLLNASTDDIGPMANGLEYALELDEHGHHVEVYLDGIATQWPGTLADHPDHPVNKYFSEAMELGIIEGACGYCAHAFDAADGVAAADIPLLGGEEHHAPDVGALANDGYEFLTVG